MVTRILLSLMATLLLSSVTMSQVIIKKDTNEIQGIAGTGVIDDVQQDSRAALNQPQLWVGLGVEAVPESLRAHVALPDGAGLVVREIVPDGPAAAAGLIRHDILLSANGESMSKPSDLVDAVRESKAEKMTLEILRKGQSQTIEVTPEKRPDGIARDRRTGLGPGVANPERVREWLKALQMGGGNAGNGVRVPIVPGQNGIRNLQKSVQSNNLSVQIQKQNDEPAKIKVQRDGETWEVTEDTLDALPEDIRPQVEGMVKGNGISIQLNEGFPLQGFQLPDVPQVDFQGFDEQFREMNKQMEKMMEQMRRIEQQRVPAKAEVELDEA